MNVPANVRFKQLASSAQRLAGMTFAFGDKYVAVNIPSTAVDAVENDHVARRYAAIVGGPEHQSPQISAKIVAINLNPTWTVPASIIKNEIIPKMRRQPNYLSRARIRILDGRGAGDQSALDRLEFGKGDQLHPAAGFRRRQFARPDPHRHAQSRRGLYARHAVAQSVRQRLPLPVAWLRARRRRL